MIAVLCVGPLALPLLWWRPKTSLVWKIGLTVAILLLTWVLVDVSVKSLEMINQSWQQLQESI